MDVPVWGDGGFALYTVLPFVCPAAAFLLALTGIGISPVPEDEKEKELEIILAEENEDFASV